MRLLLDTHVLIWLTEGDRALPRASCELLDSAAVEVGLAISSISFWEVAMLERRSRITLGLPVPLWRKRVLAMQGIVEAPVTGDEAIESVLLPGDLHGDPADRMLVATARLHGWCLVTRDERLLKYGKAGHVAVLLV